MPASHAHVTSHHQPWVVADIGGTHARFAWVDQAGHAVQQVQTLPTTEFSGPAQAMQHYLAQLPAEHQHRAQEQGLCAAWALATAVDGDWLEMTNARWRFSRHAEQQRLGLQALRVFNDFEALAWSLPHLGPAQLRSWDDRWPSLQGPLAVIGPGTGLGVAGMMPTAPAGAAGASGWAALPGEGGHMTLAVHDDFEAALLQRARQQWPHVSAERLLSGIGLPLLHRCVCEVNGWPLPPLHAVQATTPDIMAAGLAGEAAAQRTLQVFCAMLGGFAGNVALTLGARGGVYIGGGLVPRLGDFFFASDFRQRFEHKGRFAPYLQDIPTVVITDTLAALCGVSAAVGSVAGSAVGSAVGAVAGAAGQVLPST
ncbi:MAG: glucokinase [Betaproteobacteria bacterium]|jgi:glucokinase